MDLREIAEELDYRLFGETRTNYRHDLIMFALRSVAPRWVPVGEGLPPPRQDVPLLQRNGTWVKGWYERERGHDRFWTAAQGGPYPVDATHWTPLPPPPEGCK